MRRTFWIMLAVLSVTVGICMISMLGQLRVIDKVDSVCGEAVACVLREDIMGAMYQVNAAQEALEETMWFMELVASHDQLHEAMACAVEARVALECEDVDDAYQALAELQGVLDHLREHEVLSLANLC